MKATYYLRYFLGICMFFNQSFDVLAVHLESKEFVNGMKTDLVMNPKLGWVAEGNHWFYYDEEGKKLRGVWYLNDHYEWFDQSGIWKQSLTFNQWMTGYENVDIKLNEVLTSLIQDSWSATEKLNQIKNWMVESLTYENVELALDHFGKFETDYQSIGISQRDIYGAYALMNGKGICTHYAELFKMLANSLGFKTITVTGKWRNQPHAWNATLINNQWFYSDLTLVDSSLINHQAYFLMPQLDSDYQEDSLVTYQRLASYQSYEELHKATLIEIISSKDALIEGIRQALLQRSTEISIFYIGEPLTLKRFSFIQEVNSEQNILGDIQVCKPNNQYLMLDNIYRGKFYQLKLIDYDSKINDWLSLYGNLEENDLLFHR